MNIWNDLPSPLRQKVIKSIRAALNNLILREKGANNTPAVATKPRRVVLNKTAMEALMMEPDIETPIISAIHIPIAKDLFFDAEDRVDDGDNDSDNEHDDIHSARSRAQRHRGLQLDDDQVENEGVADEDEHGDEDVDEDEDEYNDVESESVDDWEGESSLEDVLQAGCDV
jgi:hypothetical protein